MAQRELSDNIQVGIKRVKRQSLSLIAVLVLAASIAFIATSEYGLPAALGLGVVIITLGFGALIFVRPEIGLALLLFAAANVFFISDRISLPALGDRVELRDLIFILLFVVLIVKRVVKRDLRLIRSPLNMLLLLFLGATIVSAVVAFYDAAPTIRTFQEVGAIAYYGLCFLILYLVREEKQLRFLIKSIFVIAALVAVMSILQFLVGSGRVFLGGYVVTTLTGGGRIGVISEGLWLINITFIASICLWLFCKEPKQRNLYLLAIGLYGLPVILSFTRGVWIPDIVVLLILFLLLRVRTKLKLIVAALLVSAGVLLLIWGFDAFFGSPSFSLVGSLRERIEPLFTGQISRATTMQTRAKENSLALREIEAHPILGIGLGNVYYPFALVPWDPPDFIPRWYIHNGYLWVAMKMGLPGLLVFLSLLLVGLVRGYTIFRRLRAPLYKGVVLGFTLGLFAYSMTNVTSPVLIRLPGTVYIGMMLGINEAIWAVARSRIPFQRSEGATGRTQGTSKQSPPGSVSQARSSLLSHTSLKSGSMGAERIEYQNLHR